HLPPLAHARGANSQPLSAQSYVRGGPTPDTCHRSLTLAALTRNRYPLSPTCAGAPPPTPATARSRSRRFSQRLSAQSAAQWPFKSSLPAESPVRRASTARRSSPSP